MRATILGWALGLGVAFAACHNLRAPSRAQHLTVMDAAVPDASSAAVDAAPVPFQPAEVRLVAFGSEGAFQELAGRLQRAAEARERAQRQAQLAADNAQRAAQTQPDAGVRRHAAGRMAAPMPSPAAPAAAEASSAPAATVANGTESITNNQEQGVDEGDIVKVRGDDILILRRGRLYCVRLENGALVAKSVVDVGPPGVRPASWYDEMLVHGDTVLVLGYGYERRATEVNRFTLDASGTLRYRDSVLLRSGDYYSSRNYATRVVGHHLVLYTPVPLLQATYEQQNGNYRVHYSANLPATRTLTGEWTPAADWGRVYRPVRKLGYSPMVHTVHFCDLTTPTFACRAQGVVGPPARTFYVSRRAVYLWVTSTPHDADPFAQTNEAYYRSMDANNRGAVVYRFPFADEPVTAVMASGGPIDQFSFRETADKLQVLVTSDGNGDGMWGPEVTSGDMGVYQIPLGMFSQEVPVAPAAMLRRLPRLEQTYMLQNRFVGDYLLYGSGQTWWRRGQVPERRVIAHNLRDAETQTLPLPHGVDRIEPMGRDAVVVGVDGNDLHLTSFALEATARAVGHLVRPNAAQGETRSHGFFYLPSGEREGTLGLPLRRGGERGWRQLFEGSAEVMFARVRGLEFHDLGSLRADAPRTPVNDRCVASCMDWYGNARPIFYRGRIFALMGYELVEGVIREEQMTERGRTDYFEALRASVEAPAP